MYLYLLKNILAAVAVTAAFGLLGTTAQAEMCVKSVRWNDNRPYSWKDPSGAIQGLYPDLVREALRRVKCTPKFLEMPWARALIELEEGRLDVLPDTFRRPEREHYAYFSVPIRRSVFDLFVSADAARTFAPLARLSDLRGTSFRLGVQTKVAYGAEYEQLVQDPRFAANLVPIMNWTGALAMLREGRLDGLIDDEVTGVVAIRERGLDKYILRSKVQVTDEVAMFALSRRSVTPAFVQSFDSAINSMMGDGSYRRIMERHLPCTVSVRKLGCD